MFLVAGCSDPAPEPAPLDSSPSASTEQTATAEPEPTSDVEGPPEMPAAAKGTSRKSAEAFVRYAVDVLNYTSASLDTEPLRALSASGCKSCEAISGAVDELRSAGGRLEDGLWSIRDLGVVGPVNPELTRVQVLVETQRQRVIDSAGAEPRETAAESVLYDFTVTSVKVRDWRLNEIVEQR
ncbi:hypothetical protein G7072_09915 [Nocardioides sp. HDW12B]|uniref:DUF6318 family protein n=1 Tax=Nocardioides sp. HDW12B TaxID=2714939 RepID=UPI00140A821E|nr:DUF6318 family protein [Nocardioides sp. HDW12B]QIK66617.1 hypothetical protein G7072_09915 [Nocardioides sp. HDW12B]